MNINQLPYTCSAFYVSGLWEGENIKEKIAKHFKRDCFGKKDNFDKHVCCYIGAVYIPKVKLQLENAGFKEISSYYSHRHHHKVYLMQRNITRKEWNSGILSFLKERKAKVK